MPLTTGYSTNLTGNNKKGTFNTVLAETTMLNIKSVAYTRAPKSNPFITSRDGISELDRESKIKLPYPVR